jgi:IS5 family transposase
MQGSSRSDRQLLDAEEFCRHLVKPDSVHAFLADHRSRLFPDELFQDLFPSGRGRPSVPADVIATVMVLQSLEGLSDREACRALQCDISWKVACGLGLTDEAFHPTVLVLWRNKLRTSERPERIFEAVRVVVDESGVIAKKYRRALDSTVLDDAVQRQDTISLLQGQIRRVRKLIPELTSIYVHEMNLEPGRPLCDFEDQDDIDRLISELIEDAYELVFAAEDLQLADAQADAVALLALVAGQDVEPGDAPGRWKITKRTAPDRIVSVVDPESRHVHKTSHSYRDGFKAHVAAEPETGIITATDLTAGNVGDAQAGPGLLANEPAGTEVLGDSAYGSGELRRHLHDHEMTAVIKPMPLRSAVAGGFTLDDFTVDNEHSTMTCPEGFTVSITEHRRARFTKHCATCPVRHLCTKAKAGRTIVLHEEHQLLRSARATAATEEFETTYRTLRPMVERTLAWLVRKNARKVRYRGIERNKLFLSHRAAAINLTRLVHLGVGHGGTTWVMQPG